MPKSPNTLLPDIGATIPSLTKGNGLVICQPVSEGSFQQAIPESKYLSDSRQALDSQTLSVRQGMLRCMPEADAIEQAPEQTLTNKSLCPIGISETRQLWGAKGEQRADQKTHVHSRDCHLPPSALTFRFHTHSMLDSVSRVEASPTSKKTPLEPSKPNIIHATPSPELSIDTETHQRHQPPVKPISSNLIINRTKPPPHQSKPPPNLLFPLRIPNSLVERTAKNRIQTNPRIT